MDGPAHDTRPLSRLDDMTRRLQLRICLMDPDQTHILYENSLADEFGVSRTPVRQVLQRLAYEHQVETRTGVGTVVPQLPRHGLAQDIRLLSGLLDLSAQTCGNTLSAQARSHLSLLQDRASRAQTGERRDATDLFETYSWMMTFVRHLVPEPILADTSAALSWRVLRRLLQQTQPALDAQCLILDQLCKSLMAQHDAQGALRLVSRAVAEMGELSAPAP